MINKCCNLTWTCNRTALWIWNSHRLGFWGSRYRCLPTAAICWERKRQVTSQQRWSSVAPDTSLGPFQSSGHPCLASANGIQIQNFRNTIAHGNTSSKQNTTTFTLSRRKKRVISLQCYYALALTLFTSPDKALPCPPPSSWTGLWKYPTSLCAGIEEYSASMRSLNRDRSLCL